VELGTFEPLARLIDGWRATAEVYDEPAVRPARTRGQRHRSKSGPGQYGGQPAERRGRPVRRDPRRDLEVEPGPRVLPAGSLPELDRGAFDPSQRLAAFLDAVCWSISGGPSYAQIRL
jgi:hypothetical protein